MFKYLFKYDVQQIYTCKMNMDKRSWRLVEQGVKHKVKQNRESVIYLFIYSFIYLFI